MFLASHLSHPKIMYHPWFWSWLGVQWFSKWSLMLAIMILIILRLRLLKFSRTWKLVFDPLSKRLLSMKKKQANATIDGVVLDFKEDENANGGACIGVKKNVNVLPKILLVVLSIVMLRNRLMRVLVQRWVQTLL